MITVHRQGFTDAQNRMIDEAVALLFWAVFGGGR